MSALHIWLMAARPRTLPAAVAPVLVGTALAATEGTFKSLTFVAAMLGALFIQVGTNLSNDYSDARRGADTEDRLGPVRVTAGGLVPPRQVLVATYVAFGLAVLAGAYLIATAGWELLLIGVASILAGVLYTGGPRPYGYEGLGEVFVFLFFGVVAVTGSYFAQVEQLTWEAFVLAVPVGLLASAILVVNNVRDLETDRRAGKRTLAVRLGRDRGRGPCTRVMVYGAFVCALLPWLLGLGRAVGVAAAAAGRPAARRAGRPDRAHAHRRAVTERRAGADRHAPARVLLSPLRGDPGELMAELSLETVRLRLRAPLRAAWGEVAEREVLRVRLEFGDGDWGEGEAAPLEPYDGVSLASVQRRARRLRARCWSGPARAPRTPSCSPRARPSARCRRRWRRSTSRCGIAPAAGPGFPVAQLIAAGAVRSVAVNATIARRGPDGRGRGGERDAPRPGSAA